MSKEATKQIEDHGTAEKIKESRLQMKAVNRHVETIIEHNARMESRMTMSASDLTALADKVGMLKVQVRFEGKEQNMGLKNYLQHIAGQLRTGAAS